MWNGFMEKAKHMAADLDQQLNESVGIDDNGKKFDPTTNATANGTNVNNSTNVISNQNMNEKLTTASTNNNNNHATIANPSTADIINLNENDGDAWNDDFDFGDDDDDVVDVAINDDDVATDKVSTPSTTATKTMGVVEQKIIPEEKREEKVIEPSKSLNTSVVPAVVPTAQATKNDEKKEVDTIISTPIPPQAQNENSTTATSTTGDVTDSIESTPSKALSTTLDEVSEAPPPKTTDASTADVDDGTTTAVPPTPSTADNKSTPTSSGEGKGSGGLFSFAQKVTTEAATGGVTSLFATMTAKSNKLGGGGDNANKIEIKKNDEEHFGNKDNNTGWDENDFDDDDDIINDDDDDDANVKRRKNDGSDVTSTKSTVSEENSSSDPVIEPINDAADNVATTPKPTGGGGLFSNFSNLAKTADTLLTAAVQSGEGKGIGGDDEEEDAVVVNENNTDQQKQEKLDRIAQDSTNSDTDVDDGALTDNTRVSSINSNKKKSSSLLPTISTPTSAVSAVGTVSGLFTSTLGAVVAKSGESSNSKNNNTTKSTNDHNAESGEWDNKDEDGMLAVVKDNALNNKDADDGMKKEKDENDSVEKEESSSFIKLSLPSSTPKTEASSQQQDQQQTQHKSVEVQKDELSEGNIPPTTETTTTPVNTTVAPIINIQDDPRFKQLQETLRLREEQLLDKGGQLNELQTLMETRDKQYKQKMHDTKEEAKKRIQKAKERCEAAEAKLQTRSSGQSEDATKQQLIIDELLEEGQALAVKQSAMEKSVRAAKAETRSLTEELQQETYGKEQALEKIVKLENDLKSVKGSLASARAGESQAGKLESDLLEARADAEAKTNTILSLQQRMKESSAESKELKKEVDTTRKSAAHESQQEKTSMRREHNDLIGDLELKIRTTEREAGVREDALRHEVAEIRKRWQDAVRRADALSMDMQSSTAPLLRQLESMERQGRLRTANAAELESRLRSELEEATIENETLGKDCSEFKSKLTRLERFIKERDEELAVARKAIEEQTTTITDIKRQEEKLKLEAEKRQVEYEKVERLANEGVSRLRSEMTQTVIDSEERYRGQIDKMEKELKIELEKRNLLEDQVGQLLENTGGMFGSSQTPQSSGIRRESKPKKLHRAEGQAEILAGALGLGEDSDDNDTDDDDEEDDDGDDPGNPSNKGESFSSFAALEQLSSKLRSSEAELKSMRKSLKESTESRQSMVEELGEGRHAKEKLPLFEFKVKELSQENREMEREIAGLKGDIADVRELYRTQLNVLLEEKTASISSIKSETPPPVNDNNQDQNDGGDNDR